MPVNASPSRDRAPATTFGVQTMKQFHMSKKRLCIALALFALVMLVAAFDANAATLFHSALAHPGMLIAPVAAVTVDDIKQLVEQQGAALEEWKSRQDARITGIDARNQEIAKKGNRPGAPGDLDAGERKTIESAVRSLLTGEQSKANDLFIEAKAMSVGSDPDGGYVVHPMLSSGMTKVMQEISPIYRLARKVTMTTGDAFEEPVDREAAEANWVGETDSRSDTGTPKLAMFRVDLKEITAMPKVSQKLIDVADIDVVAWLNGKVGESFAAKEGDAYHNGDGILKPKGILAYPTAATVDSSRAWGTFEHIATGVSGAFPTSSATVNPADKLVDVSSALRAQYRTGAAWLMNRTTAAAVRKLKDAEGRHVWVDSLVAGQPPALLGFPVEIDEDMPNIGADSLSIAFGNIAKAYTIIERPGTKFLADPYTDKPFVKLFSYRRVGGGVNNTEALKFLKFGTA
jgi:HK97 family phage major capsid protein